ncbi:hypothetical protein FSP39_002090 [Pinctada imbricata]|uniref:Archaemetzincin-2 n=1 Tax=Pinctada imbricata TaxID=66713 RepID=A0AA88YKU7_PINIB|nr:hypothetical protein FSP39_002090 [Pinctada imbricata]
MPPPSEAEEFLPGVPDYSTVHQPLGELFTPVTSKEEWRSHMLSEEQIDQFWRDGYLLNVPLLSPADCDRILEDYKYFTGEKQHPGMKMMYEYHSNQSGDPNNVLMHGLGQWRLTKLFHDIIFLPQAVVKTSQLLNKDRLSSVYFWHDQLFAKPPRHGGCVAWHQDYSYWTRTKPQQHLTVHVALEDQTEENGALHYIPGSHRPFSPMKKKKNFKPVCANLKKGEASFHHALAVHGSYGNKSDRPRRATVLNYFADGTLSDTDEDLLKGIRIQKGPNGSYRLDYIKEYPHKGANVPADLSKYLLPDLELFKEMRKPKRGDWLAENKERGQTFKQFLISIKPFPNRISNTIFLQPLVFNEDPIPKSILTPLSDFASTFFGMPVKVAKRKNLKGKVKGRINDYSKNYQVSGPEVLSIMVSEKMIPREAFCVAGITFCDLYHHEEHNFVFGMANLSGSSGVYSLARYLSNFAESENTEFHPEREEGGLETIIKRACKTMCHEIGHMFGITHCTHFDCIMNGSNSLEESDRRTIFLCPICLRKLHSSIGFDIVDRYRKLKEFWEEHQQEQEVAWLQKRLEKIA